MAKPKGYKKVPEFWWDIEGEHVIVECDDDEYPIVAAFSASGWYLDREIEQAKKLIADFRAGRKDYRKYGKTFKR